MKMIANKKDTILIHKISKRVCEVLPSAILSQTDMDLTACHLNGNPLNLEKLLTSNESDLIHDIAGINRYLDRDSGKLTDCFIPRLSA